MRISIVLIFASLLLLTACDSLKQSASQKSPPPEWVKTKPVNSFYYIGIGSAPKTGYDPADYTQTAQQQALGDLSREISVNISSSSVLSVIENNYHINENWSSEIKQRVLLGLLPALERETCQPESRAKKSGNQRCVTEI